MRQIATKPAPAAQRAVATATETRAEERGRTAAEIEVLAAESRSTDPAVGTVLTRLADAVRRGDRDEIHGYADAVDARVVAEMLTGKRGWIWGAFEVARNVLVFAPIMVTWFGLSRATDAYSILLTAKPELAAKPFLLLWEQGFEAAPGVVTFSTVAIIDASLIALLILLSLVIHIRADVRDVATRTQALLKESQIRGLLGHATSLATSELPDTEADAILDAMAAEERRIYERAMEREQQLFDMEAAVSELRDAARKLAVALAFASNELPTEGDRLAKAATAKLNTGLFTGTVVKTYHELVVGDPGRTLSLELYLYY